MKRFEGWQITKFKPGVGQWVLGGAGLLFAWILYVSKGFNVALLAALAAFVIVWGGWVLLRPGSGQPLVLPLLATITAFVLGGVVIALAAGADVSFAERLNTVVRGYAAILDGAVLKQHALTNTLVAATPLIFTGLSLVLGFRSGLFNIGAEGQFMIGAVTSVFIAYAFELPIVVHVVLSILVGAAGGAVWGAIPGYLKARLGAHEVINTIMMNFIAIQLADWLVRGPMKDPSGPLTIRTPLIYASARLPRVGEWLPGVFGSSDQLHMGTVLAILAAVGTWWLLWKTIIGFGLRIMGSNPDAARYAGIKVEKNFVMAMALSGALAGLAGTVEVLAITRSMPASFAAGYGFDAISVALLAQNHPIGVIPAAILFGALRTGSDFLQIRTGVSRYMVAIIQATILLLVAAPSMIRWLYRLRMDKSEVEKVPLTRGWGS